ncbi:hypothetical protein JTE90_018179 [Oedothorax gibbosus]|uniref:DUF4371 domain-containing protein n=1 Tax=Oedothorax gibbosus TaxID=931172 RepID=A0AAV6U900_9ARAC|nr:hypothetical protein JTE90_018179 [Oedothorax gibbosus]
MHTIAISSELSLNDEAGRLKEELENFQAIKGAIQCLNFLAQHNLPHSTLFEPFVTFCIEVLKSPVLLPLAKEKNASYRSYRSANEFLETMASVKREEILQEINSSPCFSVLSDETSDLNNRKHMAVAVKYINKGAPKMAFVQDKQLPDGKAETIYRELIPIIDTCGSVEKLYSFTSDGAGAMIGVREGVASKLEEQNYNIASIIN